MINFIRKLWNKIFGKTSLGWYYDNKKLKGKAKNKRKNQKQNNVATSTYNRNRYHDDYGFSFIDLDHDERDKHIDFDLLPKNADEKSKKSIMQFTKKIIVCTFVFCLLCITKYYLSENVSPEKTEVTLAMIDLLKNGIVVYCTKAFFETAVQKGMEIVDKKMEYQYLLNSQNNNQNNNGSDQNSNVDDTEAVG